MNKQQRIFTLLQTTRKYAGRLMTPLNRFLSYYWLQGFYRATLCVSAVFAVGRRLSVRRLSVCLSAMLMDCIQMAEDIVKLLSRPDSPHHSSFDPSATQFQGNPIQQGRKIHGSVKILRFSTEIVVYLGNGTRLIHGCYMERWRIDKCRFRWPWVILTQASITQKRCVLRTKLL